MCGLNPRQFVREFDFVRLGAFARLPTQSSGAPEVSAAAAMRVSDEVAPRRRSSAASSSCRGWALSWRMCVSAPSRDATGIPSAKSTRWFASAGTRRPAVSSPRRSADPRRSLRPARSVWFLRAARSARLHGQRYATAETVTTRPADLAACFQPPLQRRRSLHAAACLLGRSRAGTRRPSAAAACARRLRPRRRRARPPRAVP